MRLGLALQVPWLTCVPAAQGLSTHSRWGSTTLPSAGATNTPGSVDWHRAKRSWRFETSVLDAAGEYWAPTVIVGRGSMPDPRASLTVAGNKDSLVASSGIRPLVAISCSRCKSATRQARTASADRSNSLNCTQKPAAAPTHPRLLSTARQRQDSGA